MRRACIVCGKVADGWRCDQHKRDVQPRRQTAARVGSTRRYRAMRRRVFERDGHQCVECGSSKDLTADHILAVEHGGKDEESNLITRCALCHRERHGAAPRQTRVVHGTVADIAGLVPPQQVIALCGPPGSGKTTAASSLTIPSISVDDYRNGDFTRVGTKRAFARAFELATDQLRHGQSVIVDSTAVTRRSRDSLRRLGRSEHVATSLVVFDCTLAELLERNRRRAAPVPEFTIAEMYEDYLLAKDTIVNEGFRTVLHIQGGAENLHEEPLDTGTPALREKKTRTAG